MSQQLGVAPDPVNRDLYDMLVAAARRGDLLYYRWSGRCSDSTSTVRAIAIELGHLLGEAEV